MHALDTELLKTGTIFNTSFESDCVITQDWVEGDPTVYALDSDGVECQFPLVMILEDSLRKG